MTFKMLISILAVVATLEVANGAHALLSFCC